MWASNASLHVWKGEGHLMNVFRLSSLNLMELLETRVLASKGLVFAFAGFRAFQQSPRLKSKPISDGVTNALIRELEERALTGLMLLFMPLINSVTGTNPMLFKGSFPQT